jgi:antitoxin ParD1/3/4
VKLREALAEGLDDIENERTVSLGVGEEVKDYLISRAADLTRKD